MKKVLRFFGRIQWRLTLSYMLATVLVIFLVELLYTIAANHYAFGDVSFIFSMARILREEQGFGVLQLDEGLVDQELLDSWIDEFFVGNSWHGISSNPGQNRPNDGGGPPADNAPVERQFFLPKTLVFSRTNTTLVVTDLNGDIYATSHENIYPSGDSIYDYINTEQADIFSSASVEDEYTPDNFAYLNQDTNSVTMVLKIREDGAVVGYLFIEFFPPTFMESLEAAFLSFIPDLPRFLLMSGFVGIFFGWVLAANITRRIKKMAQVTTLWGQGNFEPRVTERGADELSELSQALNAMSDEFQSLLKSQEMLVALEERNRLARDLHDSVKQQIFAVNMTLGAVKGMLKSNPEEAVRQLETAHQLSQQTQKELSSLIHTLRPMQMGEHGLVESLEEYTRAWQKQAGIAVVFRVHGEQQPLPRDVEQALFRIVQEGFANIVRHSRASAVILNLSFNPQQVMLEISDNGRGFDPETARRGLGLQSMHERALELGGKLTLESNSNGTTLLVRVPLALQVKQEQKK